MRIPGSPVDKRIQDKGIKAADIKDSSRLSAAEVRSIPIAHVFMWVQTGKWSNKDFMRWLSCKGIDNAGNNIYNSIK